MEIRNLISITDFSVEEIDKMIGVAGDIMTNPDKYIDICKGKKLATLFFEPSTRTRLSFLKIIIIITIITIRQETNIPSWLKPQ